MKLLTDNNTISGYQTFPEGEPDDPLFVPEDKREYVMDHIDLLEGQSPFDDEGKPNLDHILKKFITEERRLQITAEYSANAEREWRNAQLTKTDKFLTISDFPINDEQREALKTYRQALREWPSHPNFPTTESRPVPATIIENLV